MATDSFPYPKNIDGLKQIVAEAGTYPVRALMTSGYVFDDTDEFVSDITGELSGGSYARVDLTGVDRTVVDDVVSFLADDAAFAAMTATGADGLVVFADRGSDAVSPVIAFVVAAPFDVSAEPVTWRFNAGKVLTYSPSDESEGTGAGLPDQDGNAGKFLTTDGTDPAWGDPPGGGGVPDPTGHEFEVLIVDALGDPAWQEIHAAADPEPLGTAAPGTSLDVARGDHVHPMPSAEDVGAVVAETASAALWIGTQAAYNALGSWSSTTVYAVTP